MENHPIPQDITGFKFKLIGNMTIKQFAYLAVGVILGWILFALPINPFIKIPLSALSVIFGASLAFLPIEGRPMDLMIKNFIKALFRPTQFVYKKSTGDAEVLNMSVSVAKEPPPLPSQPLSAPAPQPETPSVTKPLATPVLAPQLQPQVKNEQTPIASGLPPVPEFPNLITGVVKGPRNNPLPNMLVEIKDAQGNPVRAFKTNQLGQFASSTSLSNGDYTIEIEDPKEQNKFNSVSFAATGEVVSPIEIISVDTREELRRSLFGSTTG